MCPWISSYSHIKCMSEQPHGLKHPGPVVSRSTSLKEHLLENQLGTAPNRRLVWLDLGDTTLLLSLLLDPNFNADYI